MSDHKKSKYEVLEGITYATPPRLPRAEEAGYPQIQSYPFSKAMFEVLHPLRLLFFMGYAVDGMDKFRARLEKETPLLTFNCPNTDCTGWYIEHASITPPPWYNLFYEKRYDPVRKSCLFCSSPRNNFVVRWIDTIRELDIPPGTSVLAGGRVRTVERNSSGIYKLVGDERAYHAEHLTVNYGTANRELIAQHALKRMRIENVYFLTKRELGIQFPYLLWLFDSYGADMGVK